MKIRLKLYILTVCSVLLVLLVGWTLLVSTRDVNAASAENRVAHDIILTLFELGDLTRDYLLHESVRAQVQWARQHEGLVKLTSETTFRHDEDWAAINRIRGHSRELAAIFAGVVKVQTMMTEDNNEAAMALKQRYMGQFDTRLQAIVSEAVVLERRSLGRVMEARRRAGLVAVAAVIILAGFMVVVSVLFSRSVVRPIQKLHVGTEIIGSGDLNYKVDTGVRDEVGLLSRAFDEMTERLKMVTVSRDELAREMVDRKRAEEQARRARKAAEEANRAKSQFLTNMSHELRTPLNSVIGFANILGKNKSGHLDATELLYLQRIAANGKHLLFLINQILDLAKIEVHKVEVDWRQVDIRALIHRVLGQMEGAAQSRSIRLVADVPQGVAAVMTDEVKLAQVLINLIGNAIKFTDRGEVRVSVVAAPEGGWPRRIEVCDTGIGISPERIGSVFEAFQQAESGMARKYGGTGLGLTISRALCDLMGYRIEVASQLGKGSTFSIVIPEGVGGDGVARGDDVERGEDAQGEGMAGRGAGRGKLALVIDDERDARTLLSQLAEEAGCRVLVADSGEAGLRMAREFHPDIITLDLLMPTMDGWAVLKELKSDPDLSGIPVVVVSIVAQERRGQVLGAVDVLQKPVAREALMAVLQRNLHPPARQVLVVDDSEDDRRLMAAHLADSPYVVRLAASGTEALQMMAATPPDALVVDLIMPDLDGSTLIHRLRADERYRELPVVIVTGRDLAPEERRVLRLQAHAVLPKSATLETELPRTLKRLLSSESGRA